MSFEPGSFQSSEFHKAVTHLEKHKDLGAHLLARHAQKPPTVQAIVLLADHGIADTAYSRKSKNYTFAQTIAASEGSYGDLEGAETEPLFHDVAVDRYWPQLDKVLNFKVARGSNNFLNGNALEPQRLLEAVNYGAAIVHELEENTLLYLCDLGAGNDIAAEALLSSLGYDTGVFDTVNPSELIDFRVKLGKVNIDPSHPFNYLERFGGYDTAVSFGILHKALEKGMLTIVDGWAAFAAFALSLKFQPSNRDHALLGSSFIGSTADAFIQQCGLKALTSATNDLDGGKQFLEIQRLVSSVWTLATNA